MKTINIKNLATKILKNKPVSIKYLPLGLTNDDYLITTKENKYIFRIPKPINKKLFNYKNELNVLTAIKSKKIDVELVYFDNKSGIKVTNYIPNLSSYKKAKLKQEKKIKLVTEALIKVHQTKVDKNIIFNPVNKLKQYQKLVAKKLFKDEQDIINQCNKDLKSSKLVLCHNDLVDGNLLFSNSKLYLIDYEYAGYNHPLFDLASFLSENNIEDKKLIKLMLKTYYKKELKSHHYDNLIRWYRFNDLLWSYWAFMMYQQEKKPIFKKIYQLKSKRYLTQK